VADYEGMRWFKCDLQMQTPADASHWRGAKMGASTEEQQSAAEAYIRRCYEVGLEVIAITDHNFLSKGFVPLLQQAIHDMTGEFGYRIVMFPGFEFEANVGKGVHVLGLFEPDSDLDELDHVLTACGVGFPRIQSGVLTKSTSRLADVLPKIQALDKVGRQLGLVVMPHAMKDDGLFDNNKVSDWLQQTEFLNPDLLAVEVPKPVGQMSKGWQRLFDAGDDCDPTWRRSRPIACVMSSDNKALTPEEDAENYIGMRYTWIKMSKPSIEALRQAFLDPSSRIRLMGGRPSDAHKHPRITGVTVKGAKFLADQTLRFSEGLNCVIGGRGSGKSSLLEYMRFALNQDETSGKEQDAALSRKRTQLKESLGEGAEIRITFEAAGGVSDTLVYEPSRKDGAQRRIEGREVYDLTTVTRQLQAQFFSQGELSRMTNGTQGQAQVLALIDASSGPELIKLNADERELKGKLKALFQARRDEWRLLREISVAQQEATELTRQLEARASLQGDSQRNQRALQARRFLDLLQSQYKADVAAVEALRQSLKEKGANLPKGTEAWPNADWFAATAVAIDQARSQLIDGVSNVMAEFQGRVDVLLSNDSTGPVLAAIEADQAAFRAACAEKGIREEDIARLQELEEARQGMLKLVDTRAEALSKVKLQAAEFEQTLAAFHAVWRRQFDVRQQTADDIQSKVASNTVRLRTTFMNDQESFRLLWKRLAPRDGRSKLARRWEEIGDDLFGSWRARNKEASPWETAEAGRTEGNVLPAFYGEMLDDLQPAMLKHLDSEDIQPIWEDIRLTRVGDGIDVDLLREDQTVAGSMTGALSEGQRNTVLLNLMLAKGEGPIVIDQPEDELDSSFIFKTLVTDLRSAKLKRQLIIATHNANLPVNADAELIYALEARDGQGQALAQGGLDRAHVSNAVLDIMEGSEQAFKRRSEKYHF